VASLVVLTVYFYVLVVRDQQKRADYLLWRYLL
jgi:preprotein translocase subunit YajC